MKLVYTGEHCQNFRNSIFLAGCSYRDGSLNSMSWRREIELIIQQKEVETSVEFTLIIPEMNPNIPLYLTSEDIYRWETFMLSRSSSILFWIPRDMQDLPGLTTNIEFGEWMSKEGVFVGYPDDAEKNGSIKVRCEHYNKVIHNNLYGLVQAVIDDLLREPKVFFTSDTHFGQQRTLELSKRPFKDVEEMDRIIISNWNKRVRYMDTVYHLGDFGEQFIINQLVYGEFNLIEGNYDEDINFSNENTFKKLNDEIVIDDIRLYLNHYPPQYSASIFNLFGHIHSLQKVKQFGLNVGIDAHNYNLIDIETVKFYKEAIEKHYDFDVFIA